MELKVVIVDDVINNSKNLQDFIERFKSKHNYLYKVIGNFTTPAAYNLAKEFIANRLDEIDILLIDYNLGAYFGSELFKLVNSDYQIYKILHSITDDSLDKTQDELHLHYNKFCKFKDVTTIHKAIEEYEDKYLEIKILGIPQYRKYYFISEDRLKKEGIGTFYGIEFYSILYATRSGNEITVCYRNTKSAQIEFFNKISPTALTTFTLLGFVKVTNKLVINLLWLASISISSNRLTFITLGNKIYKIRYHFSLKYMFQLQKLALQTRDLVPPFLR